MKKKKKKNEANSEPYEDRIRFDKLDPYEALIKSNLFLENKK